MKKFTIITIITISILAAVLCTLTVVPLAQADDDGAKIYVHFYNGTGEYEYDQWGNKENVFWGAYYWVSGAKIVQSSGKDPEFAKGDNQSNLYVINLTDKEASAIKSGKKMGLIMVRAYIDENGRVTPYWNGNKGKDMPADRYIKFKLNERNEAHIWIVAGDKNNYTNREDAVEAFSSIEAARFDTFGNIDVQTAFPITSSTKFRIYAVEDGSIKREAGDFGTQVAEGIFASASNTKGSINTTIPNFDWNTDYYLWVEGYKRTRIIDKSRLYLSPEFERDCIPDDRNNDGEVDVEFGAIYSPESTTFRFWGPISTKVMVNLYTSGNEIDYATYSKPVEMTLGARGVWTATVEGDLDRVYYTYTNYVEGEEIELCDPYATAAGVNGNRAMVCNFDNTDPIGWEEDLELAKEIRENNSKVPVIWEIHVRDFSISADSGIYYKGKFLAFTEQNTHVKGEPDLATGIAYLKELGVNYIHLNPVYDFATVDEEYIADTDHNGHQNWGYDPKNYNVPEGSYSTDPNNGEIRINEFKQMVMALHQAGIGVIMDVVYNHTYTANSFFEMAVPGYYYRQAFANWSQGSDGKWYPALDGTYGCPAWAITALGDYEMSDASGCSNETASERAMFRSYMVNSVRYWVEEYHIDGFRFDLMGIHDTETMNYIRAALNGMPGGEGILIYGEPWSAAGVALDPRIYHESNYAGLPYLMPGIKVFNSTIREAIKGNNGPGRGFVNGNVGAIGSLLTGLYGGTWDGNCSMATSINYTTSHDNYSLWDQLVATTITNPSPTDYVMGNALVEQRNMMAASLTLLSTGTSFILAGEEIGRTKFGNHNSYNAQDQINAFDYYRQAEHAKIFSWYKGLIAMRTQYFTTLGRPDIANNFFTATYPTNPGVIGFGCERVNSSDAYSKFMVLVNASGSAISISYDEGWYVIADSRTATFNFDGGRDVSNSQVVVPAYTTLVLVQR